MPALAPLLEVCRVSCQLPSSLRGLEGKGEVLVLIHFPSEGWEVRGEYWCILVHKL